MTTRQGDWIIWRLCIWFRIRRGDGITEASYPVFSAGATWRGKQPREWYIEIGGGRI